MVSPDPLVGSVQVIPVQYCFQQVTCTVPFFSVSAVSALRFCIPFVFHTISLQEALVPLVFCFQHTDLLGSNSGNHLKRFYCKVCAWKYKVDDSLTKLHPYNKETPKA